VITALRVRAYLSLVVSVGLIVSVVVVPAASATPVWSVSPSPNAPASTANELTGVSCPSTTSCFAVGSYITALFTTKTLVERWNENSWGVMKSPNPPGFTFASLLAVSCPSATSCFAVGSDTKRGTGQTLIEHWNGTSWKVMSSPSPGALGGGSIGLTAVSCPSVTSCMAVGESGFTGFRRSGKILVEHWNGNHWSVMPTRNPPRSTYAYLAGVACPSTKSCFAIGDSDNSLMEDSGKTLIEHWNGRGGWSIMTGTANPGTYASLLAVSCPSTTSCEVVPEFVEVRWRSPA